MVEAPVAQIAEIRPNSGFPNARWRNHLGGRRIIKKKKKESADSQVVYVVAYIAFDADSRFFACLVRFECS
ncbi:MAG TPA: hypothetical protein DEH65_04550 [Delftia acidovorans]|nr:hypothetical protein [Delftia acidovorans]